jgi:hypothetical protein
MKKTIRLTESELINLVKRVIKEQEGFDQLDDTPIEDEPSLDDEDMDGDIDDIGFDVEDEFSDDDEFQNKMRFKERTKKDKPSGLDLGDFTRWDSESDREVKKGWSPIKSDDLPLDKFLKSKYNKFK